jgi:thiamine-phosphate pyrophosphorylase
VTEIGRFYPVVPDAVWVGRLAELGVGFIQLRVKDASPEIVRAEIDAALAACSAAGASLVVNDYWRDAIETGAEWVHLGQDDLRGADLASIRAAGLRLGISTHSESELEIALKADPDYVALGPIYETTLKKMPFAPQGLARIAEWKRRAPCPLVAIGGITLERGRSVYAAGADSIAVVSDVTQAADPDARVRDWLALTDLPGK